MFLAQHPDAMVIDQCGGRRHDRSNPATYTGLMDEIRKLFAKANGVSPALFSFNSKGACPDCQGLGVIYTDLAFMDGHQVAVRGLPRGGGSGRRCCGTRCAAGRSPTCWR